MKVFISWSGNRSKQVAELLDDWIQCVIQAVDPWLSSKDIDRGALWFSEINNQLSDTKIGIVCLTKQNREKPWILFESGALAKGLSSSRVCTFLIDLKPQDIDNPLAQFNHTSPNRDGMWNLVRTINLILNDEIQLSERILEKVFDTYYPEFDEKFKEIIKNTPKDEVEIERKGDDIMNEVLSSVRMMERRLRNMEDKELNPIESKNSGIRNTLNILQKKIADLKEQDMTDDVIFDYLYSNTKLPKTVIHNEILKFDKSYKINGKI